MSFTSAKVLANTVNPDGERIVTVEVTLPRVILAQLNKHGLIRHSTSSSRAIPFMSRLKNVDEHLFIPRRFPINGPGMVPKGYCEEGDPKYEQAKERWLEAYQRVREQAIQMHELGVHKEAVNRLLEPWTYVTSICTCVQWANFFKQRIEFSSQQEMQELAVRIFEAIVESPTRKGSLHAPYLSNQELEVLEKHMEGRRAHPASRSNEELPQKLLYSIGRAAGASYERQADLGRTPDMYIKTGGRIIQDRHWTPVEHVALWVPEGSWATSYASRSWLSLREYLGEDSKDYSIFDEAQARDNWMLAWSKVEQAKRNLGI
jgi:hypothetical protein